MKMTGNAPTALASCAVLIASACLFSGQPIRAAEAEVLSVGEGHSGPPTAEAVPNCTTPVPGGLVVSQTWTPSGSPYCITGNVQVSLLTIQAGVQVLVDGPYQIDVLTSIQAIGTPEAPIVFGPRTPGSCWKGIKFTNTGAGSQFSHCVFEGADSTAITLTNAAAPSFSFCTFRNNSNLAGSGGAVNATGVSTDLTFSTCMFSNNSASVHGGALRVLMSAGSSLRITQSIFEKNTANPAVSNGEYWGGALWLEGGDATITDTRFDTNRANSRCSNTFACGVTSRGGGVYVGGSGTVLFERSLWIGNETNAVNAGNCFFGGSTNSFGAGLHVDSAAVTIGVFSCNSALATPDLRCGPAKSGSGVFANGGATSLFNTGNLEGDTGTASLDTDFGVGVVLGLDVGSDSSGWAFSTAVRYYKTAAKDPSLSIDVDPIQVEIGVGYRY